MNNNLKIFDDNKFVDQFGNEFYISSELSRGGQGVVYRTTDKNIAIKIPLGPDGNPDMNKNLQSNFMKIRCLPIPSKINLAMPISILRDVSGYVMNLLNDMNSFSQFEYTGNLENKYKNMKLPVWLNPIKDQDTVYPLIHYLRTGSTKRRLNALYLCANILCRLHSYGLVYCDVSPNNVFTGEGESDVWLIDADNLRFEFLKSGHSVYSPRYGAPEVVQSKDKSRPYGDIWAFSVMAFEMLSLTHPFIGEKVLADDNDEMGWDDDWDNDEQNNNSLDLDEQAYMGLFPYIDDKEDDSNRGVTGLPRELVLTPLLAKLFQDTFGEGRLHPWYRPTMAFWSLALAKAHDMSIECDNEECGMSYYLNEKKCPYCQSKSRGYLVFRNNDTNWEFVVSYKSKPFEVCLPDRLFHNFSIMKGNDAFREVIVDFSTKTITKSKGTEDLPDNISYEFRGGE